ncbi:MAG: SDR family NAD(P)-dependent oxidoreductase [Anaerolineales bacterium]
MVKKSKAAPLLPPEPPLTRRPRAVVVGASSGIGAAIARRLAAEGHVVAALARSKGELDKLCGAINAQMGETRALAYQHDVTDLQTISVLFQRLLKDLGGIDVLVYCAGVMPAVAIDEFDLEKDKLMIETNLMGGLAWLGLGAALFQRMGAGHLVGISSVAGDRGRVLNPAYNASKAGLDAYLEALRNRLTRRGVHVLTVKPGFVDTEMLKASRSPKFGVVSPETVAGGVWKAMRTRKQLVYIPWIWRWIMLAVRNVPSFIFRRLSF